MGIDIQDVERLVIRVLLNDPDALVMVTDALPEARYFADARCAAVYRAMQDLAQQTVPPNPATVADVLGVELVRIQELAIGYSAKDAREVVYLAELVGREGQRRLLQEALREATELAAMPTDDVAGLAFTAMQMVAGTSAELSNRRDPAVAEVGKQLDQQVAEAARSGGLLGAATRLPWLNDKTGGMTPATVWVIAGPYKFGRKTSLARNLVIDACRAGAAVDFFALEGNRVSTYAGLWAMLATDRLLKWQLPDEAHLSDTFVMRGMRSEMQASALAEARRELEGFRLFLYDGRDGIGTTERIAVKLRRDQMLQGVSVMVVDYLQLIGTGRLFDRLEASTHAMQRLIVEQEICGILIAQLNESTIWQMRADQEDSYSPGIKGGGDPAAAADYLFRTLISQNDPTDLKIELKLARHARPGYCNVRLNEQSGHVIRQI